MLEKEKPKLSGIDRIVWISLAITVIILYLFALHLPLLGPDEPRYAQVSREMLERGDWVTTTLGGFTWFEKPALLYWLQIISFKLFGVNEFAARLGPALLGLGTIASLFLMGKILASKTQENIEIKKASGRPAMSNYEFHYWLTLITSSSIGLIVFSRGASFDITITFPITVSLTGFFIFDQSKKESLLIRNLSLITFYFFMGVALIAKGLIGCIFPLAIVAFYFVLAWKIPDQTFFISLFWGSILSLLVASSWYLPMYLTNGWEFINEFFIQHHFERFISNKYRHPGPFWFFWIVLPAMTIPWLPFFLIAFWDFMKNFLKRNSENKIVSRTLNTNYELKIFAFSWMLVPLVFFSLSGSKLPGYILPALPAAGILTTEYVLKFIQKNKNRKRALQGLAFSTFVVVAILLKLVVPHFAEQDSTKSIINAAKKQGYSNSKILNLHTISHNAEFYGAGRLVRESNGKQKLFRSIAEIAEFLEKENAKSVLVLVPHEYLSHLTGSDLVKTKVLDKNAELTIVSATIK